VQLWPLLAVAQLWLLLAVAQLWLLLAVVQPWLLLAAELWHALVQDFGLERVA
jgi:hypothetical protein